MMNKISAVYQIVNTVTGDRYVGSSKNVKRRWASHKKPSTWKQHPNNPLYRDMQKYGLDKFRFQILAPVMEEYLTQVEQEFIDMLHPTYNSMNAKGLNVERYKEYRREYQREYQKE
jgi:group I intron endonuclease